jgi:pyruvate/2-oxoglutarate dehydrogenase complex dihydrolipoamide acyltransferase (E2) component
MPVETAMVEVDVGVALERVTAANVGFARVGVQATLLAVVAEAVAAVLPEYPLLQARYSSDGIVQRRQTHLAVGMPTVQGMAWCGIAHAGDLTLRGIARAMQAQAALTDYSFALALTQGRQALPPLAMSGALLTVSAPQQQAVVLADERIALRPVVALTLSYDARVITFADAGRFLRAVQEAMTR